MSSPTVMAVDGNSLLHRSFHANARTGYRLPDGRAAWAVRGLLSQLTAAADRACADAVVVGFDDPVVSMRRQRWPHYKAQRSPKLPGLQEQLEIAVETLREVGVVVVVPDGLEADDVLASVAAYAPTVGARTVLVTSDRDAVTLVDERTRLLRIINGGVEASPMLDPVRARLVTGVRPDQYRDLAALRGDPSDNLSGVHGIGTKKATLLLERFGTAEAVFADARAGGAGCRDVLGASLARTLADPESHRRWRENCAVMAMHGDVPLGLTLPGGPGRLPLRPEDVRRVYGALDLGLPNALRALCGVEPKAPRPDDVDPGWQPPPMASPARHAPLRTKKVPAPAHVQGTLF